MARSIKIGTVNYAAGYLPPAVADKVLPWQAAHTDFLVGGPDVSKYDTATVCTFYLESAVLYATGETAKTYRDLQRFCADRGYDFEQCLIHMKVDYKSKNPWSLMDKFGWDENANGVIIDNGGTLTDKTVDAYTKGVTFSTALYIGSDVPFDQVNIASQSGMVGTWEYSCPTGWSPLTFSGVFTPPADWTRTSILGSWNKYFVRFVLAPGSPPATTGKITGDNWRANTANTNCRGWDETSPSIINSGELAYNPTPPAHATAKFKQQARVTGAWAAHTLTANVGYVVDGDYVWGEFIAHEALDIVGASPGFKGVFYDDIHIDPLSSCVAPLPTGNFCDFADYTAARWGDAKIATYRAARDAIHAALPAFLVGGNTYHNAFVFTGDWAYAEMSGMAARDSALSLMADYATRTTISYDGLLDKIKNPRGTKAIFTIADHVDYAFPSKVPVYFERGNRGPMTALASHLVAQNELSYLHYYTFGGWRYGDTDEIYLFAEQTTTLAQPIAADTTSSTKHLYGDFTAFPATATVKVGEQIVVTARKVDATHLTTTSPIYFAASVGDVVRFVDPVPDRMSAHPAGDYPACSRVFKYANYFPAMLAELGVPDPDGWNGGKRGVWHVEANKHCVLRRDYAHAIVLFREVYWSSTAEAFTTFGDVMPLGGTYCRMNSDATLGDPITEIKLRCGEGAVLMKYVPPVDPIIEVRKQLDAARSAIETCQRLLDEPIPIAR
jgi:hypothetical protein